MFLNQPVTAEIVGVYRMKRERGGRSSFQRRHSSIGIRLSGNAVFLSDGEKYNVGEGKLIYIPPGVAYSQVTSGEEAISVRFIEYSAPSDKIEIIDSKEYGQIKELFIRIHSLWSERSSGYQNLCTSLLYEIFYLLEKDRDSEKNAVSKGSKKITEAAEYIHTHFKSKQINISQLAKMAYMSEAGFRKSFKSLYGVSPNRYIKLLKLEYARALLESGLYTVSETAVLSGFGDPKYFSGEFSRHFGMPPGKYAKSVN